jgi:uncharacterized protein
MFSPTIRVGRLARWVRAHRWLTLCLVFVLAFLALNVVAFNQAWSMTHFVTGGSRTSAPEGLALLEKARVALVGVRLPKPVNNIDPSLYRLPSETVRFGGATGVELEGWYIPHSQAKGIVLLAHGYGACKASLLYEANAFDQLGYATFLFDCHGSGGSEGSVTSIGVREADDVADAFAYVGNRFPMQPRILFGQSMGSAAILRAISVHGIEPAGVIVECPFDRLLSTAENRFHAMGLPAFPAARLIIFWGGVQLGFNGFRHNPVDYARDVHCPVLFLQGEEDTRVTLEQARSIFANLASEKTFVTFPKVGHQSLVGTGPLWAESVSAFLAKVASAP